MINIAVVGIGFMGATHYHAAKSVSGARVSAIVTRDPKKQRGDWSDIQGNFGPSGGVQDLSGVKVYATLDEALADDSIDLVDICLPTFMHREAACKALEAGKHVLVEKPISISLEDAEAMLAAEERSGRRLFVGQVLRFFPEFAYLKQLIESGEYGALTALHLKRVITKPNWREDDSAAVNGGVVIDLHVHDVDFVQYLFGMPEAVFATGVTTERGDVTYLASQFVFGGGPTVSAHCGAIAAESIPFEHGYDAYFERANISFSSAAGGLRLYTKEGRIDDPPIDRTDGFVRELQYVVDALEGRTSGEILSGRSARNSLRLCHLLTESVKSGKVMAV